MEILNSVSNMRQVLSPTATHDSWDEPCLREKSSVSSRAAYSENAKHQLSSDRLPSFSSGKLNPVKEFCHQGVESPAVASRTRIEEANDRLSVLRDGSRSKVPSTQGSSQISGAVHSKNVVPQSERQRTTKEDRMSSLRSQASDDQMVERHSCYKKHEHEEFLSATRDQYLALSIDTSSSESFESGLMDAMKNAPENVYAQSNSPKVSFADDLTDSESSNRSSVSSRRDRDILSCISSPASRSILKTRSKIKNIKSSPQAVAFADNLTDGEDSSYGSVQRLSIEVHLRDKKNKNHLLNYQPWIDRRIVGEFPDASSHVSSSTVSTRPLPPPPARAESGDNTQLLDNLIPVTGSTSISSSEAPLSTKVAAEGGEDELEIPKVFSASSVSPGVPIVTADSVTNVPVVEAGSVSTGTLQHSRLQLTVSASILRCEGPPPTDIEFQRNPMKTNTPSIHVRK